MVRIDAAVDHRDSGSLPACHLVDLRNLLALFVPLEVVGRFVGRAHLLTPYASRLVERDRTVRRVLATEVLHRFFASSDDECVDRVEPVNHFDIASTSDLSCIDDEPLWSSSNGGDRSGRDSTQRRSSSGEERSSISTVLFAHGSTRISFHRAVQHRPAGHRR